MPPLPAEQFARAVDHTLLDPGAGGDAVARLCAEADQHRFAAVCVFPWWVEMAASRASSAAVCTVIGFPHGLDTTSAKCDAARAALHAGADEIDVVMAWAALRDGDESAAGRDMAAVAAAVHDQRSDAIVKVIIESSQLTDAEITAACRLVAASGAEYAKTSTGPAGGASPAAVALMRRSLPDRVLIKASGGIRSAEHAAAMLDSGASRLGTSRAVAILDELEANALAR
jgi:deoxyribose-phosphate aldolase